MKDAEKVKNKKHKELEKMKIGRSIEFPEEMYKKRIT